MTASVRVPGPPVALVHGWGGSFASTWGASGWPAALAGLGRPCPVIELPGHGPGSHAHDPASYADLATSLSLRLPADEPLDAIGFSLGAKLLLELACRHPGRFRRLVLGGVGANAFAPEKLGGAIATALEHGVAAETPEPARRLAAYGLAAGNDPLALAACLRRVPNPILSAPRLAAIRCPILLVVGDEDAIAQPVAALHEALQEVELARLPGAAHLDLPGDSRFQPLALSFCERGRGL